ncbi:MAG: DUF4160 domain-containing protein [Thermoanaerobaculia bacterium]
MPTLGRFGPFRFFFYSNEGAHPPHVHVQQESKIAKFWLDPVALASTGRFFGFRTPLSRAYRVGEPRTVSGVVE